VTCAHEFKHSSQYAGSRWSEGGWVELDATWMEDIAYPETNDYLNYLPFGSPIAEPDVALDGGSTGTGSYEDCVLQHFWSQTHGIQLVVDLYDYRITHQSEPMLESYTYILEQYGHDWVEAWGEFTMWNFATGARFVQGYGYLDGPIYPAGSPQRTIYSYPNDHDGSVTRIAANFIRCLAVNAPGQAMRLTFNGNDTARMTLAAVVNKSYATQEGAMYLVPLDDNNDVVFDIPYDLDGVYSVGIIVGNANKVGGPVDYSIDMELVPFEPTAAGDVPAFAITGNYPNPFNPQTTIKFALDHGADTVLDIYDVAGRKVTTVLDATLGAGQHRVMWNGTDQSGRSVASGTYVAKLRAGDQVTSHKLVLAK
jgi:hypothetical protein